MKHFTIENETNNITIHTSVKDVEVVPNSERFSSEAALAKLAAEWPAARLVEIWNSLPGESPVKKFKDRATAVSRIWKVIQNLEPAVTTELPIEPADEQSQAAQPEQTESNSGESSSITETPVFEVTSPYSPAAELPAPEQKSEEHGPATDTHVAPQGGIAATEVTASNRKATRKKKTATEPKSTTPRAESKTAQVIAMLKREGGATVEEIMTAMGWLKHTTRAMLSAGGSLVKNRGLTITSEKVGEIRRYYIKH